MPAFFLFVCPSIHVDAVEQVLTAHAWQAEVLLCVVNNIIGAAHTRRALVRPLLHAAAVRFESKMDGPGAARRLARAESAARAGHKGGAAMAPARARRMRLHRGVFHRDVRAALSQRRADSADARRGGGAARWVCLMTAVGCFARAGMSQATHGVAEQEGLVDELVR